MISGNTFDCWIPLSNQCEQFPRCTYSFGAGLAFRVRTLMSIVNEETIRLVFACVCMYSKEPVHFIMGNQKAQRKKVVFVCVN